MARKAETLSSGRSGIWSFLNSAFGVFLLSSVVLGGISFGYKSIQEASSDSRETLRLKIEIAARERALDAMVNGTERNRYSNYGNMARVITGDTQKFWVYSPIFDDFKGVGMSSLLWRLYVVQPHGEHTETRASLQLVEKLQDQIRRLRFAVASEPDSPDDDEDKLKRNYGQSEIAGTIRQLRESPEFRPYA